MNLTPGCLRHPEHWKSTSLDFFLNSHIFFIFYTSKNFLQQGQFGHPKSGLFWFKFQKCWQQNTRQLSKSQPVLTFDTQNTYQVISHLWTQAHIFIEVYCLCNIICNIIQTTTDFKNSLFSVSYIKKPMFILHD